MYHLSQVDLGVVVLKGFILGSIVCGGAISLGYVVITGSGTSLVPLSIYMVMISIFHMLEFLTTYWYNPTEVDSDLFLLSDYQMLTVNIAASVEYLLQVWFGVRVPVVVVVMGLVMACVGQYYRTMAMYTAGKSFNHLIQREHSESHKLITSGVYNQWRHPLYFGFWWWFIGLQVMMANLLVGVVGAVMLWKFFRGRIIFEEGFLIKFFKQDYVEYARCTPIGIPGITTNTATEGNNGDLKSGDLAEKGKHD